MMSYRLLKILLEIECDVDETIFHRNMVQFNAAQIASFSVKIIIYESCKATAFQFILIQRLYKGNKITQNNYMYIVLTCIKT